VRIQNNTTNWGLVRKPHSAALYREFGVVGTWKLMRNIAPPIVTHMFCEPDGPGSHTAASDEGTDGNIANNDAPPDAVNAQQPLV